MNHSHKLLTLLVLITLGLLGWWWHLYQSRLVTPAVAPPAVTKVAPAIPGTPPPITVSQSTPTPPAPLPGIGNLPAPPFSGVPFNKKMLFGYPNPTALMIALHEKTLRTLSQGQNLKPEVLQYALQAYACAVDQGLAPKQRYLTIIDYSLPATTQRFWVIDLRNGGVLFHTLVAHGRNSGFVNTDNFSDVPDSKASSLGLFVTESTYTGHNGYSLKLDGLEPGFNANALNRNVVIHGAAYVSPDFVKKYHYLGRSWGCPALSKLLATPVINQIKQGSLVFAYYPSKTWLEKSTFLHCKAPLPWTW